MDQPTNGTPAPQATAPAEPSTDAPQSAPPQGERTYTQREVDTMAANFRRKFEGLERDHKMLTEEMQLLRDRAQQPAAQQPSKGDDKVDSATLLAELQEMRTLRAFDQAVQGMPLNEHQRGALETLFKQQQPDAPSQWAASMAEQLGWQNGTNAQPQPQVQRAPGTPVQPDRPAPAAANQWQHVLNPNEWSADDIARIYAEKGVVEGRKFITERAEQWLKNARVVPPMRK